MDMNIIKALKSKGFSKWRISKEIGVSWQTIHMWEKEVFKPQKEREERLIQLLNKTKK